MDLAYFEKADFWSRVDRRGPEECWPWRQSKGSHGYGQTWDGRTVLLAHRVAWALAHGPIPAALTVDHLCHVRMCCNPAHLRLLPNADNARDNGQGRKVRCPRGHPYDEGNTYRDRRGHRRCRLCARLRTEQERGMRPT